MNDNEKPLILAVDDLEEICKLVEKYLTSENFRVKTLKDGKDVLGVAVSLKPSLILLDVMMPGMSGYEVCAKLKNFPETKDIPVVFVTALNEEQDKAKAFAIGATGYITKPFKKEDLIGKVRSFLNISKKWEKFEEIKAEKPQIFSERKKEQFNFSDLKKHISEKFQLDQQKKDNLEALSPHSLYEFFADVGLAANDAAKFVAEFLGVSYYAFIDPEEIALGKLPTAFARKNAVVAVNDVTDKLRFIVSNPFDMETMSSLSYFAGTDKMDLSVASRETINTFFRMNVDLDTGFEKTIADEEVQMFRDKDIAEELARETILAGFDVKDVEKSPVRYVTNQIIYTAINERASDIHIEPKKDKMTVRFRIDGDLRDYFNLKRRTGIMVISRLKAMGDMDIAERRKPQDGTIEVLVEGKSYKLRLSTTATPEGESMVIRILYLSIKPKSLKELGMTDIQLEKMRDISSRTAGLMMIVGPTGSGKSTTVYSLLSNLDFAARSLMTIEDPVEYRIPYANQHQVNDKAGITFESLLKSAVRQDPDIIFLGEMRDQFSAKAAMDIASTGHLVITTMHSANATTAVFRLERLGLSRELMADSIAAIIAQRLLKKLCEYCKKIEDISEKEKSYFAGFTNDIPKKVAHPVGCPKCGGTGFFGREGIYEILEVDAVLANMIRKHESINRIRNFVTQRGDYLIVNHVIEKVRNFIFTPQDAYSKVLTEEIELAKGDLSEVEARVGTSTMVVEPKEEVKVERIFVPPNIPAVEKPAVPAQAISEEKPPVTNKILIINANPDSGPISSELQKNGFETIVVSNGVDAMKEIMRNNFRLIISDIDMPNLNGNKLLEIVREKGEPVPVILLTTESEDRSEIRGLQLGADDYMLKPVSDMKILLKKVKKITG